eukprot:COSAG02_NODE_164_length_32230_cov_37.505587_10_plen_198_part_00
MPTASASRSRRRSNSYSSTAPSARCASGCSRARAVSGSSASTKYVSRVLPVPRAARADCSAVVTIRSRLRCLVSQTDAPTISVPRTQTLRISYAPPRSVPRSNGLNACLRVYGTRPYALDCTRYTARRGAHRCGLALRRSHRRADVLAGAEPLFHYQRCRHGARVLLVDLRYRRVAALQHHYRQPPRERIIILHRRD